MENLDHPIETQEYAVYTAPVDDMFETIKNWLDNHVAGAYIYGLPRFGKSRAIKFWLGQLISQHYGGKCAVFRVIISPDLKTSSSNIYDNFILSPDMGIGVKIPIKLINKRQLVLGRLTTLAHISSSNRILIVVDEAQNLSEYNYRCYCDLQTRLDEMGFRVTFIFVGSYALKYQHNAFQLSNDLQLIGRFLLHRERFRGILTLKELKYVLDGYDNYSEWPENSNTSYTRYYFTKAYDAGFRISNYAESMWDIFQDMKPSQVKKLEIAMEHIGKAIEYIFRNYGDTGSVEINITKGVIKQSIGFTQFTAYMNAIPKCTE